MDAETAAGVVGLGGVIAAAVALAKAALPVELSGRQVAGLVLVVTTALVVLGVVGGEISGTPLDLVSRIIVQAASAVGLREGLVLVAPAAKTLPGR
ncbi:MAG: hypothetical protein WC211_01300 [Dehalococcoidia bacterium]